MILSNKLFPKVNVHKEIFALLGRGIYHITKDSVLKIVFKASTALEMDRKVYEVLKLCQTIIYTGFHYNTKDDPHFGQF